MRDTCQFFFKCMICHLPDSRGKVTMKIAECSDTFLMGLTFKTPTFHWCVMYNPMPPCHYPCLRVSAVLSKAEKPKFLPGKATQPGYSRDLCCKLLVSHSKSRISHLTTWKLWLIMWMMCTCLLFSDPACKFWVRSRLVGLERFSWSWMLFRITFFFSSSWVVF